MVRLSERDAGHPAVWSSSKSHSAPESRWNVYCKVSEEFNLYFEVSEDFNLHFGVSEEYHLYCEASTWFHATTVLYYLLSPYPPPLLLPTLQLPVYWWSFTVY